MNVSKTRFPLRDFLSYLITELSSSQFLAGMRLVFEFNPRRQRELIFFHSVKSVRALSCDFVTENYCLENISKKLNQKVKKSASGQWPI